MDDLVKTLVEDFDKKIVQVELLANLLFTEDEIKEITGFFSSCHTSTDIVEFKKAYKKGKTTRLIKLRQSLLQLADNGSHPALEKSFALLDKMNASDV